VELPLPEPLLIMAFDSTYDVPVVLFAPDDRVLPVDDVAPAAPLPLVPTAPF